MISRALVIWIAPFLAVCFDSFNANSQQEYCVDDQNRAYEINGWTCILGDQKAFCTEKGWQIEEKCPPMGSPYGATRGAGIIGNVVNGTLKRTDNTKPISIAPPSGPAVGFTTPDPQGSRTVCIGTPQSCANQRTSPVPSTQATTASALNQCDPDPFGIAEVCHLSCGTTGCQYETPLLGKLSNGHFIMYRGRNDPRPIYLSAGMDENWHVYQIEVDQAESTLYFYIDEQPDYSLFVDIRDANGTQVALSQGNANETMSVPLKDGGVYYLRVIKQRGTPGGDQANYVPTLYLFPTVQPDAAGDTEATAFNVGTMAPGGSSSYFEKFEYLQFIEKRDLVSGNLVADMLVSDTKDFYRFDVQQPLFFSASIGIPGDRARMVIHGDMFMGGSALLQDGVELSLSPGTYYLEVAAVVPPFTPADFSIRYKLTMQVHR